MRKIIFILSVLFVSISLKAQELRKSIYFDFSKSQLNDENKTGLEKWKDSLSRNKILLKKISLFGFCDSVGNDIYNDSLSVNRAINIKKILIEKGIDEKLIHYIKGYGKRKPKNKNTSESERQANRRVDILIEYAELRKNENEITGNIDVTALVKGKKFVLRNLNFIGGMHHLLKESIPALKDLRKVLNDNPKLEIEIIGYICCKDNSVEDGTDIETGLDNLSLARAKEIYNYLVQNGISQNRLRYKGMGAKNKITEERTEEEKTINRRVEIEILKK